MAAEMADATALVTADRDADGTSRSVKRRAVSMRSAMAIGRANAKTLPLVAMARPKAAPAAANLTTRPCLAAVTQASKQRATKKVSQLSVVKKWASWIDIGARAAKSAAISPTGRPARVVPSAAIGSIVSALKAAEMARPTR